MKTRPMGRAGIEITPIGIGTWAMGAGKGGTSNLGAADDEESISAIRRGVERGLNWIDTAAYYGFGHAEEIVAKALDGMAERPFVFTKCGLVPANQGPESHEFRLKAWSVRQEIEASLRRLRVETLDLVMLHWPIPDEEIEEGWTALAELQQQGKARFLGVSNFSSSQMARCERIAPIDAIQPEYSLADRVAEEDVFPYAEKHNIGAIVYSPLKHGLLSGSMTRERIDALGPADWRRGHAQYIEPLLSQNLGIVDALRSIAARHHCSPAEVAVAWVLLRPAVAGAIVGGRRPSQFDHIVKAAELKLSDDDLTELETSLNA